jgi:multidrug resistance efflux pump
MDEAADQSATVLFPPRKDGPFQVTRAHAELLQQHGTGAVCTVPLTAGTQVLGAIVLELPTGSEFDARTVELCEHAALLVGPVLDVKRREDRWLAEKAWDSMSTQWRHLVGPQHAALKFWAALCVIVTLFFSLVNGDYMITADASLEGTVQRAVTAAMQGYILDARARAGDVVRSGDVLATLDDRDLRLERVKLVSQGMQQESERRQAIAEGNRAKARILEAQLGQVQAQIILVDEQIARTRLLAPFDAVVVKGDLSQSLGAAVERGNVLFEVAPLDTYRVIMKVDERDITDVAVGQTGRLALTSMPNEEIALVIDKITPVSVVDQGRNYFRVEAVAKGAIEKLRPGMEGVGKIQVDQRKLFWIWTHKLVHWVHMWLWSWWP